MTFSDRLNPIFVYEIRRVVRNRSILALLCVYLVLSVAGIGFRFWCDDASMSGTISTDTRIGGELALFVLLVLYLYTLALTLRHTLGAALHETFVDELAGRTALDWKRTAVGKLQVSACLTFLFYSSATPFLTLAWMLRGVDLPALLIALVVMFLVTLILNFYLAASLIRCRTVWDVLAAALGLLLASPPLFYLGAVPIAGVFTVSDNVWSNAPVSILAAVGVISALVVYFGFRISWTLFAANWQRRPADDRFFTGCMLPWGVGFILMAVGFLILGIVSVFV